MLTAADIHPAKLYDLGEVGPLFRRGERTLRRWIKAGLLKARRSLGGGSYQVFGHEVLRAVGANELATCPVGESETEAERTRRANAALDSVLGPAKPRRAK